MRYRVHQSRAPAAALLAFLIGGAASAAQAATVSRAGEVERVPVIAIDGVLDLEDVAELQKLADAHPGAIVALRSPGGELRAGLGIGTIIRDKGLRTSVPSDALCASACALAWLGGVERLAGARAQIGFHAAFRIEDGKASETGAGNALVGAYLNRLSLPDRAIVFVTQAPPERMNWLTPARAREIGIVMAPLTAHVDRLTAGDALFGRNPEPRQTAAAKESPPEQASLRSSHSDWRLYVGGSAGRKTCHLVSSAGPGGAGNAVTISRRPAENVRNEVAVTAQAGLQQGPAGTITVDDVAYPLLARGQYAWVRRADEADVVARMARASGFTTVLRAGTGDPVAQRHSTDGLAAALARAEAECP